ncbi:MAG: PIG-L family deacetylase [Verrucomicrobiales bacterium]|nr:PIG-L family deacetylase [Verrucomicrobiales bacterium]
MSPNSKAADHTDEEGRDLPRTLNVSEMSWQKAAVIIAHPDDETFCSGLICELTNAGAEVLVCCVTKGEGGPTGGLERAQLGAAREAEMKSACRVLGVKELLFLGHIDPVTEQDRVFAPNVSVSALSAQIAPLVEGFDLVICHGSCGEYRHPGHLLVFDAVKHFVDHTDRKPDWMTFLARNPEHPIPRLINPDDQADYWLDVGKHRKLREEALACHRSQISLFGKFAGGDYRDFIAKTSLESYCKR